MDEIKTLIEIAQNYHPTGKYRIGHIFVTEGGIRYNAFHNEHYDEHHRICYEAATNFINKSNVFSELTPEEIIKSFANIVFKDDRILVDSSMTSPYFFGRIMNYLSNDLKLFEELLRINKEMLLALIKAINDKKITYIESLYFVDKNGVLGAISDVSDYWFVWYKCVNFYLT